jgi:N-acetylmuramic acid 6-phosphate etherase
MSLAAEKTLQFLEQEQAFRLGTLLTESPHPKTLRLGETAQADLPAALRMLLSVDEDIPPAARQVFASAPFRELVESLQGTLQSEGRIFFTGCGATGRLSILLEALWRRFWQTLGPDTLGRWPSLEDRVFSVMAGGDFALIRSVEGFEDFPAFGRCQLRDAGVKAGDLVIAVTEGGETPFVIGTAWEGLAAGARVFFVFNNPADLLAAQVARSAEVLRDPRIVKLDLATGPMALTGSTRMQATTSELLVLGTALEMALAALAEKALGPEPAARLGLARFDPLIQVDRFERLLAELNRPGNVEALAAFVRLESDLYREQGLVTYLAHAVLLDVLTDTTERSPTFMVPPFRPEGDRQAPLSWAFVKDPLRDTPDAWRQLLRRAPRGLTWTPAVYRKLGAPEPLPQRPPRLDNETIYRFRLGREADPDRCGERPHALGVILSDLDQAAGSTFTEACAAAALPFARRFNLIVGSAEPAVAGDTFAIRCRPPDSPLGLWHRLAVKLVLNTGSTATMARAGRIRGNGMIWLSPGNKKLIDRGTRLVSQVTGTSYEKACLALHEALAETEERRGRGEEVASPVALAIQRLS